MPLNDPIPSTFGSSEDTLRGYATFQLADGLSSGSSTPQYVGVEGDGLFHLERNTANAFEVELQYRPTSADTFDTVATYDETDVNSNGALGDGVSLISGEYRLAYNSGSTAVSAILRV